MVTGVGMVRGAVSELLVGEVVVELGREGVEALVEEWCEERGRRRCEEKRGDGIADSGVSPILTVLGRFPYGRPAEGSSV